MIRLDREGPVFVLRMKDGENRFNPSFLESFHGALDQVEQEEGSVLVTTGEGKFYTNGLDLDWLGGEGRDRAGPFLVDVHRLFARVLCFPRPTLAAINGHAFAGGAMLALAHDYRLMRRDRGFLCLPEVDLGLPLTPGMAALIQARLTPQAAHDAIVSGRRIAAEQALAAGWVDAIEDEGALLAAASERAVDLAGKQGATLAALKSGLYGSALAVLEGEGRG